MNSKACLKCHPQKTSVKEEHNDARGAEHAAALDIFGNHNRWRVRRYRRYFYLHTALAAQEQDRRSMKKRELRKKTLDAVGWLGSSGYQTILYSPCAKDNRAKT